MIIRGKIVHVYDIEVFKNVFHNTVRNTETNEQFTFEISARKNQLNEMVEFYSDSTKLFCGYNNHHYDDPVINYIIDYKSVMNTKGYRTICESLYKLSKVIIQDETSERWKKWKYAKYFSSFDLLTMLYSSQLRVSLKSLQVTMHYGNVQEFVHDWDVDLQESEIDKMIEYNINDVNSTTELLNRCKSDIDLRLEIENEYGISALSKDGVNLGMEILKLKYLEKTGLKWNDIKDLRSPMDYIPLNDVILPFIEYRNPILKAVLTDMKSKEVSPGRKGYTNQFIYAGLKFSVGVGGIHTINTPKMIIPKDDEYLMDIDVSDAAS